MFSSSPHLLGVLQVAQTITTIQFPLHNTAIHMHTVQGTLVTPSLCHLPSFVFLSFENRNECYEMTMSGGLFRSVFLHLGYFVGVVVVHSGIAVFFLLSITQVVKSMTSVHCKWMEMKST